VTNARVLTLTLGVRASANDPENISDNTLLTDSSESSAWLTAVSSLLTLIIIYR